MASHTSARSQSLHGCLWDNGAVSWDPKLRTSAIRDSPSDTRKTSGHQTLPQPCHLPPVPAGGEQGGGRGALSRKTLARRRDILPSFCTDVWVHVWPSFWPNWRPFCYAFLPLFMARNRQKCFNISLMNHGSFSELSPTVNRWRCCSSSVKIYFDFANARVLCTCWWFARKVKVLEMQFNCVLCTWKKNIKVQFTTYVEIYERK